MREAWNARSPREQTLIAVAAALFALGGVYLLLIAPLAGWREAAAREAERAAATYSIVVEAAQRGAAPAGPANRPEGAGPMRNTLLQTARRNGVTLNFVNLRPDGGLEASADVADAEAVFRWLDELKRQHGIDIISADIARESSTNNIVRGQFVFGAAA